jgi:hypothetical protein
MSLKVNNIQFPVWIGTDIFSIWRNGSACLSYLELRQDKVEGSSPLMIKILLLNISDLDTLSRVFCLHLRICLSPII